MEFKISNIYQNQIAFIKYLQSFEFGAKTLLINIKNNYWDKVYFELLSNIDLQVDLGILTYTKEELDNIKRMCFKVDTDKLIQNLVDKHNSIKILKEQNFKTTNLVERYCIAFPVSNQYAEGITGANRYLYIIAGDNHNGFTTKKEASNVFKLKKQEDVRKFKTKIQTENKGYGALGWFYSEPQILTMTELNNKIKEYRYPYDGTKIYL